MPESLLNLSRPRRVPRRQYKPRKLSPAAARAIRVLKKAAAAQHMRDVRLLRRCRRQALAMGYLLGPFPPYLTDRDVRAIFYDVRLIQARSTEKVRLQG
jgi:hypothetical protein